MNPSTGKISANILDLFRIKKEAFAVSFLVLPPDFFRYALLGKGDHILAHIARAGPHPPVRVDRLFYRRHLHSAVQQGFRAALDSSADGRVLLSLQPLKLGVLFLYLILADVIGVLRLLGLVYLFAAYRS